MAIARKLREIDEVDDFYDTLLRAGPFPGDNYDEVRCNAILKKINELKAGIGGDDIDAELLMPELRTALIVMVYGGRDPSTVPYRHIRHALDNPITIAVSKHRGEWHVSEGGSSIPIKMREGINGPLKAVRAMCLSCQGGNMNFIRSCPSINCFLWPFRMSSNPFFGRLHGGQSDENDDGFEGVDEMAASEAEFEAEENQRLASMGNRNGNS